MPAPFITREDGLSESDADERYAQLAGNDAQTFNCDVLNCNAISSRNNADIGMTSTSLIADHVFFRSIPSARSAPADTTSLKAKFDTLEATISPPHTLITGVAKDWMNANEVFVHFSGDPVLPGIGTAPSLLAPVAIKPKRLTMRYYGTAQVALTGGTTCSISLCKFTAAHASGSQTPVSLSVTLVSNLFTFNSTNAASGFPAVNVDLSTLNSGSPFTIAQNESLILRFNRSITIGHDPSAAIKEAEIQCCLYCELGS